MGIPKVLAFLVAAGISLAIATGLTAESALASPFVPTAELNMNGEYILSQTPGGDKTQDKFPTHYKDYPRGVKYFDVYSPKFSTLYSQVWWSGLSPVELPSDVVQRYAGGKAMAVVGFELDQVRRTAEGDVSVPLNVAYNHHFESTMAGSKAWHEKITLTGPDDPQIAEYGLNMMGHSMSMSAGTEHWVVRGADAEPIPTAQSFGGANGGEVRKSFHGYAPGFVQVIKSPKTLQITPMQIDTWNRDKMNLTGSPFIPGPLPRNSLAAPDAKYSGLLECPVTTRLRKDIHGSYATVLAGTCSESLIHTAGECFEAVSKELGLSLHGMKRVNMTISDPARPAGCSTEIDAKADVVTIYFNTLQQSSAKCGSNVVQRVGSTISLVSLTVSLDLAKEQATITVVGPADVWFGVGFNASAMKDAPWAIIVDGYGNITERKLADQNPGKELKSSLTVLSTSVAGGRRTVVVSRPLIGISPDYFSFSSEQDVLLPFINAVGSKQTLSYHRDKTASTLALLPVSASGATGACLCPDHPAPFGQGKGSFSYQPTNQTGEKGRPTTISFGNNCAPYPRTDLLEMKNPTCDVRTYVGGQIACHHMFSLLDADQEIPWPDQPLEYHLKMRFWYQDYNESYHSNVKRTTWGIASPVEYDVPKCAEGVKGCSKDEDGNWIHTIHGTFKGSGRLIAAHFHCHAPTCKNFKMYRDWNGTHGNLLCEENPVYGGTGKVDLRKFDEPGYILQPPCLWGSKEFGLEPPPDVGSTTLHSIKTSYANSGHHGEMAWQQMFYVDSVTGTPKDPMFI